MQKNNRPDKSRRLSKRNYHKYTLVIFALGCYKYCNSLVQEPKGISKLYLKGDFMSSKFNEKEKDLISLMVIGSSLAWDKKF